MAYAKRKNIPTSVPLVSPEILEQAKRSLKTDRLLLSKCTVCGADVAPNSAEGLCWVCRRLKISAWHESEQPTPAPE